MQFRKRAGETTVALPEEHDAGLYFIGRIRTPWSDRKDCPRQGRPDGPECRVELFAPWAVALDGIDRYERLEILYWLDKSRRDLVRQNPEADGQRFFGTFALRSPQRPNPIGTSVVRLERVENATLYVRGLDCLDGSPLIDIKLDRCAFTPQVPPKPADTPDSR
jgi:tRNA-Thr(GGU) m(6)t(6)A37 methyltransferase TsaA